MYWSITKPGAAIELAPEKEAISPIQTDTLSSPGTGGTGSVKAEPWVGASQGVVHEISPIQPGLPVPPPFPVGEVNTNVRQPETFEVLPVIVIPLRSLPEYDPAEGKEASGP